MAFSEITKLVIEHHCGSEWAKKWTEETKNPVTPLGISAFVLDSIGSMISFSGCGEPITPVEILDGSLFRPQRVYGIVKGGLIGTTGIGAVGAVGLLIAGFPSVALLTTILSAASLSGAFMAQEAATQRSLADSIQDLRTQTQELGRRNAELAEQTTIFSGQNSVLRENIENLSGQNSTLRGNIQQLSSQNETLRGNLDSMSTQLSQFALQNENYRVIADEFRVFVEQFRSGSVQDRELFMRKLDEFTHQVGASRELWSRFTEETSVFRENYATQLTQLQELVAQLTDPRNTLLRLHEHRELNAQIQAAVSRLEQNQRELSQLDTQISLREGQLRERDQLLADLRVAHSEILASYQQQNAVLGDRNGVLQREIDRVSHLIERHFENSIELTVNSSVPIAYTLGIRKEPTWGINTEFYRTPEGWTGRIPIGKSFKFVLIPPSGSVKWEGGSNRLVRSVDEAQRTVDSRRIEFS